MQFKRSAEPLWQTKADTLVIGIFQDENIEATLAELAGEAPREFLAAVAKECARDSFTGKSGQMATLPTFGKLEAHRLCLVGMGKSADMTAATARQASAAAARRFAMGPGPPPTTVALALRIHEEANLAQAIAEGWLLGSYRFKKYKTKDEDQARVPAQVLLLVAPGLSEEEINRATERGTAIANATNMARDMIAEPPAVMTPQALADIASSLTCPMLTCQIIDRQEAERLGMGAFVGVARGATEPPKFIIMRYMHRAATKTIALAGKGITFDSGGLSIKTALAMEHMKYDMAGAAAVIATMKAICELKPCINVTAVAVATENMPGPTAMHPGDVVKAFNGKTIEVNNTDAEGRLVLADALSFLVSEKPDEIIDVATLTGAVVTALGRAAAGIMGNNEALVQRIIASGADAGEKFWQLPLFDEYKEALKSEIADLKNAGARGEAGSPAAGMFLKEFVDGKPWVHLDIAGPSWIEKAKDELNKGGTAFGVRTLCYYILSQAAV
jgi:leucyl aminopeptidase